MLDIILKYTNNITVDQVIQFINKIYKISEDCQAVVAQYRNKNKDNTNTNTITNMNMNMNNIK